MSKLATGPSTLAWANPPVADVPAHGHRVARSAVARRGTSAWSGTPPAASRAMVKLHPRGLRVGPRRHPDRRRRQHLPRLLQRHRDHQHRPRPPARRRGDRARRRPARQRPRLRHPAEGARPSRRWPSVTPPGMSLFTFFSSGTEAIEGAMRVARAITGRSGSSASTTTTTAAPAARPASRRAGRRTRRVTPGTLPACRAATPTGARSARTTTAASCAAPTSSGSRWPRTCPASWPAR